MNYMITPYALICAVAAVVATGIAIVAWPRRAAPGGRPLVGLMIAVAIWSAAAAMEYATVGIPGKIAWAKIQYIGVLTCPVFYLLLVLEYDHLDHWLTRTRVVLLFVVPVVTLLLAFTNEWHGWIWQSVTPTGSINSNLALYSHGIAYWFGSVGYSYALMLIGTLLLLRAAFRYPNMYWRQAALLVVAALAPWIVNVVYNAGLSPDPGLELTPLVLIFTGTLFAWSILHFRLLDLAPVARETLIETMAEGMVVLDARNRVVDFNPAAQRLLALPIPLALGQLAGAVFATWSDWAVPLADVRETSVELPVAGGDLRYLELHISPIRDRDSRCTGRLLVIHDITARKAAQTEIELLNGELETRVAERTAQLAAAMQDLKRSAKMKDEFMAAVSHELRTPLTGILGMTEALEMQTTGSLNERQLHYVQSVREGGERLLAMVNSILRYTATLGADVQLLPVRCRLAELCAIAVRAARIHAEHKGQTIVLHVEPSDLTIISDANGIIQMLQALLDNAVKFTPAQGGIGVDVSGDLETGCIHLVVWDTGIGIPPEQQGAIFEPFVQGDGSLARHYEGVGLGLAYVQRMAELLGGTVTLSSAVGEGSRFEIELPVELGEREKLSIVNDQLSIVNAHAA